MQLQHVSKIPRDITPPPTGAVIYWQKSGTVGADAILPSGRVLKVADYDAVCEAQGMPGVREIFAHHNFGGAFWVPDNVLAVIAACCVTAIDHGVDQAEQDADSVVAFAEQYLAGADFSNDTSRAAELSRQYPDSDWYEGLSPDAWAAKRIKERAATRSDGWVRNSDSSCYWVSAMRDYGNRPLAEALLRQGLVVLFANYNTESFDGWRLVDPETATKALLVSTVWEMIWACGPQGRRQRGSSLLLECDVVWYSALRCRPFDRVRSVTAEARAAWQKLVNL